jgi:hypothetical protein
MSHAEGHVIRRIHDAINQSLADRLEKDQLIRSLQAENLRLRHELASLRSRTDTTNSASVATPPRVGLLDLQK